MNGRVKTIGLTAISLLFLLGCYSVTDKTETPITSTEENSSSTPTVHITAAPTIEIPTTVPSPGFIAFSTFPEREVFMIDSGGGEPVHLTTLPSNAFFPALSPDATQIVYVDAQRDSTTDRIMLMDVDGDGLRQITDAFMVFGGSLAWSSDGESIAFTGNRENVLDFPNIYVANIQDQTITQVSDDSLAEYDLAWSPNGELFAFRAQVQSGEAFTHCLFRMGRNGSNLIQITDPSIGDAAHPAWSPDGQHLAFDVGTFEDSGDIYLRGVHQNRSKT
jgi:Tol biopolymer transport system component